MMMLAPARSLEARPAPPSYPWRWNLHVTTRNENNNALFLDPALLLPRRQLRFGILVPAASFADREQQVISPSNNDDQNGETHIDAGPRDPFKILRVEATGKNMRRIVIAIPINAPLDAIYSILTDYEGLADFIPGLAVCEIEERWEGGARLFQIGEQNLALGFKFKAKGVIVVQEHPMEVFPSKICRQIDFEMVEGDFHIFKGSWKMEQEAKDGSQATDATNPGSQTVLTYVVDVQPKVWLPVRLVEGKLSQEIQNNLISVRDQVVKTYYSSSLPASC